MLDKGHLGEQQDGGSASSQKQQIMGKAQDEGHAGERYRERERELTPIFQNQGQNTSGEERDPNIKTLEEQLILVDRSQRQSKLEDSFMGVIGMMNYRPRWRCGGNIYTSRVPFAGRGQVSLTGGPWKASLKEQGKLK